MTDECLELKNIKYKTMLLNGNNKQFNHTKSEKMAEIDRFLENERKMNRAEPWGKLDQTQKMRKIEQFISIVLYFIFLSSRHSSVIVYII